MQAGCEEGEEAEDEDVEHALDWQREPKQAEVSLGRSHPLLDLIKGSGLRLYP